MKTIVLALVACTISLSAAPRLYFSKYFKGSVPEFVAITIERDGNVTYQDSKDDDNPLRLQMPTANVDEMFALAEKLDRFQRPIESGLKVANLGVKTFRYEDGADKHEIQFNYSTDTNAQALLDWFERISETEGNFINLGRTVRFDRLGINEAVLQVQAAYERHRLVAPEQFLPLLDRIIKNEGFMHMARERAAEMADSIRKPAPEKTQ